MFWIVLLLGLMISAAVAFYISRNFEYGEARFGPDGRILPEEPERGAMQGWSVKIVEGKREGE